MKYDPAWPRIDLMWIMDKEGIGHLDVLKYKNTPYFQGMALLQYGLPQVSSVCFRTEELGWMADYKISSRPSIECKNQILPATAFNT